MCVTFGFICRFLLDAGADVEDSFVNTALWRAAIVGRLEKGKYDSREAPMPITQTKAASRHTPFWKDGPERIRSAA